MISPKNLLYYSVNSYLSHHVNSIFYNNFHYVWCSPCFNPDTLEEYHQWKRIPVSSAPYHIYQSYAKDILSQDLHSYKIKQNKAGILAGATAKLEAGIIDIDDFARIQEMIERASIADFRPLIYLIPSDIVKTKLKIVPVAASANPLSTEYLICDLERQEFEIIEP